MYGESEQAELMLRGELMTLNLWSCRLGNDGVDIVAAFISYDETVLEVYLYGCNVGPRGCKAIAEALKRVFASRQQSN